MEEDDDPKEKYLLLINQVGSQSRKFSTVPATATVESGLCALSTQGVLSNMYKNSIVNKNCILHTEKEWYEEDIFEKLNLQDV